MELPDRVPAAAGSASSAAAAGSGTAAAAGSGATAGSGSGAAERTEQKIKITYTKLGAPRLKRPVFYTSQ